MKKSEIKPFLALVATRELTIPEIFKFSKEVYPKMMNEIEIHNIEVIDSIVFLSFNRNGDVNKRFRHEICIPIKEFPNYAGEFEVKKVEGFNCISDIFTGTMNEILTNGINKLLFEASEEDLRLSNQMREVYHTWETPRSRKNRVEIQFGLQIKENV